MYIYGWAENDKKNVQLNEEKETKEEKRVRGDKSAEQNTSVSCSNSVLPCMDKLREELSCAVRISAFYLLLLVLTMGFIQFLSNLDHMYLADLFGDLFRT